MSRWDDLSVNTLRSLWLKGESASAIAKVLGNGASRNAVVGKAFRLGLGTQNQQGKPTAEAKNNAEDGSKGIEDQPQTVPIGPRKTAAPALDKGRNDEARNLLRNEIEDLAREIQELEISLQRPKCPGRIKKQRRLNRLKEMRIDLVHAERRRAKGAKHKNTRSAVIEGRRSNEDARQKFNAKLQEKKAKSAEPQTLGRFEELRQSWLHTVVLLAKLEKWAASESDIERAKQRLQTIEAQWDDWRSLSEFNRPFEWPKIKSGNGGSDFDADNWNESGMLAYLGYHVGATSSLAESQRQTLLSMIFRSNLPPINSLDYMRSWGPPLSGVRLQKIAESIARFVRMRRRSDQQYQVALSHWLADLSYLKKRYYDGRFDFSWPSV